MKYIKRINIPNDIGLTLNPYTLNFSQKSLLVNDGHIADRLVFIISDIWISVESHVFENILTNRFNSDILGVLCGQ
jgi:hypothetical protein